MGRPVTPPTWATDANYPAGSDPWSGTPTRSAPSSGKRQTGYVPATEDAAEEDNSLIGELCDLGNFLDRRVSIDNSFLDDFTDQDLATSPIWTVVTTTGTVTNLSGEAGYSCMGIVRFRGTGGVTNVNMTMNATMTVATGQDFFWSARTRAVDDNSVANYIHRIGPDNTLGGGGVAYLEYTAATAVWTFYAPDGSNHSLGVGGTTPYQTLEVYRISGVFYVFVDRVLKLTYADTTQILIAQFFVDVRNTNHLITVNLDLVRIGISN